MMRRGLVFMGLVAMLCMGGPLQAQTVHGHWYGIGILKDTKQSSNSYLTELIVRQKGKKIWGVFQYFFKDTLLKVPISGTYDNASHQLVIKPFSIIYYNSPSARNSIDCSMSGYFRLIASKTGSMLQGSLMADEVHRYTIPDISYRLKFSNDTADLVMKDDDFVPVPVPKPVVTPPVKKPVVIPPTTVTAQVKKKTADTPVIKKVIPAPPPVVAAAPTPLIATPVTPVNTGFVDSFYRRDKDVTRVLEVNNSILRIELFDNGEIDNDSISVFFNNTMILEDSKLDLTPIKLTIQLDSTREYNELGMLAINLGTIPPNTALLVLYDGNTRYEVFLSSDMSKSAVLRLRKKKKKS